jgi:hypothetical protein
VVEFISEETEKKAEDEPPPEFDEVEVSSSNSLELLVEEHTNELHALEQEQDYFDEPSNGQAEYHQPENPNYDDIPTLKHELKPLVYDENETPVVIDIFERYGKKEDKWWKGKNSF